MKRRKSDCAGEGDGNVRTGESEWAPAAQLARLISVSVSLCVCARNGACV